MIFSIILGNLEKYLYLSTTLKLLDSLFRKIDAYKYNNKHVLILQYYKNECLLFIFIFAIF
jgi:hypothetical protein